ncbi:bifunctional diguanylate cyclase/phosphodiesterase [Rubellimicrobium sp. CFH 75288]|uniref:putative bifunctional diguanylate cyclase/phosphodiesterase n=1 Tax=Rubellimicrobium sp. CFH 75288 TaxID=2697034 RepID=UPI001411F1C4|nr:bifunctional diguanylate cyclase/phosphodiesterase [Rubellimicrobium sp. CFH 75288]NAZ38153.1 EAL domain-containing protein [Rubellimicrobium sp. CFH 75288]
MHRLPDRIATVIVATVTLFVATTGVSVLWMTRALDAQALAQSALQVRIARDALRERVRTLALDYAKWDAAHGALREGDRDWLVDNVGSVAVIGQTVQVVVLWGSGGLEAGDLGWRTGGPIAGTSGLLPASLLAAAEARLDAEPRGRFDVTDFFAWHDGALHAMAAAHVEAVEHWDSLPPAERRAGLLLMGVRLSEAVVAGMADAILLDGAGLSRTPPAERPFLELPGLDGTPAGFIAWDRPRPGTTLLWQMSPWLLLVSAVAAALALMAMRLVRGGATRLVVAERTARNAARTDALTGLPNRMAFGEALAQTARAGERAILFLDLDGFKGINDSLGHAAGDAIIAATARRLAAVAQGALLARIAGDEFVILLEGPDARRRMEGLAAAVERAFDAPFEAMGHPVPLRAAIGYAVQDADGMSGPDLVRQADLAMYEGKRLRAHTAVPFRAVLERASRDAHLLERALRAALAARPGEIGIAWQPITTPDGTLRRAEALARWTSAEHGPVAPARFIPVAEKAGLVLDLGALLLARICEDLAAHPGLRASINVSALQLVAPNFAADLAARLTERGVGTDRVEIELTETALIRDPALAARHIRLLREAGFAVALDDFGTGYSSIAVLDQLAVDTLKVDRSFVSGACHAARRQALLRATIQMARELGLVVVCEGVETAEDLRLVRDLGCDLVQGFLVGRPQPISDLAAHWLDRRGIAAA